MPTISLKWPLLLAIVQAILGAVAGSATQFTDMGLDPIKVKAILAFVALLVSILSVVQGVLIAFGMTSASRLAAVKELPLDTRALSFAADTGVDKIVLKDSALAESIPSQKVVGPGQ